MRSATIAVLMLLSPPWTLGADKMEKLIGDDAKVQKLARGMQFVEGPVWTNANGGYLVFSDIPANELKKWDGKELSTFSEFSFGANGNTRDLQGRLVTCAHSARSVMRREGSSVATLVHTFEGKQFNSPNDVVVKSDGTIWFTDPTYGLPQGEKKELDGNFVFRFDPASSQVTKVATDFDMPNGLCFSPNEKFLYIADSGKPHHIRKFAVKGDGTLSDGGVFCVIDNGVPDGIRCDVRGNVWSSAGDGVHVFSPEGKLILKIPVPETPANLCFGAADNATLFITARTSLYSVSTNVKGAVRPTKENP